VPTHVLEPDTPRLRESLHPDPETPSPAPAGPRIVAAIVALLLAFASFALATSLFHRMGSQPVAAAGNGKIAFAGSDGDGWQLFTVWPDGSGLEQLTHLDGQTTVVGEPAWSPDGARIAYVVEALGADGEGGPSRVWIADADGSNVHPITDASRSSRGPAWSPDGGRIAFVRGDDIWIAAADGTGAVDITDDAVSDFDPAWSPDGSRLVFAGKDDGGETDLYVAGADGTDRRNLLSLPLFQHGPAWSPDGSHVAFASGVDGDPGAQIFTVDTDGDDLRHLTDVPTAWSPAWSPDGTQIVFAGQPNGSVHDALYVMNADGSDIRAIPGLPTDAMEPAWQPLPIEAEPRPSAPPDVPVPSPKANGVLYFSVGDGNGPSRIEAANPDGSDRRVVFEGEPVHIAQIAWSPDGSRIAYRDPIATYRGIYVANSDGSDPIRLTDGENDGWPSWSPDGTKITFSSTMYDPAIGYCERDLAGQEFLCPTDVYVMEANGSNVTRLTTDDAAEFHPVWSPIGDRIAFVRPEHQTGNEYLGVFTMNANGSDVRRVSSSNGGSDFSPTWAADGSQIAFVGFRWEDWGIWVVNADGTDEHQIEFDGEFEAWFNNRPVWSPDGTSIASICRPAGEDDAAALCLVRPDGTGLTRVAEVPHGAGGIAWQPLATDAPIESSPTPDPVPAEPTAVDARVSTTTGIAPFPSGVAAGEGGVWVGARRNDGSGAGDVVRLDPVTGDIVARIPMRSLPGWVVGGAGITVGLGSVWVVGGTPEGEDCCSALVTRIDPSTNALIDEIAIPDVLFGADVWVDQTGLYVLSFNENEPTLDLASVDPETHEVRWRVPLPAQWSQTVFVSGGSVWVLGTAPDAHGPVEVNTLYRLDPLDGRILAEIPLQNSMYAPAVAPDVLWLRTTDGAQRFDPVTAQPVGDPIKPAPGCCTGAFVSDGEGGVWVISSPGVDAERGCWHIDVSGQIVEVGEVADREQFQQMLGQGYAFDPVTSTIWVQHYEDSVSRVELVSAGGA